MTVGLTLTGYTTTTFTATQGAQLTSFLTTSFTNLWSTNVPTVITSVSAGTNAVVVSVGMSPSQTYAQSVQFFFTTQQVASFPQLFAASNNILPACTAASVSTTAATTSTAPVAYTFPSSTPASAATCPTAAPAATSCYYGLTTTGGLTSAAGYAILNGILSYPPTVQTPGGTGVCYSYTWSCTAMVAAGTGSATSANCPTGGSLTTYSFLPSGTPCSSWLMSITSSGPTPTNLVICNTNNCNALPASPTSAAGVIKPAVGVFVAAVLALAVAAV